MSQEGKYAADLREAVAKLIKDENPDDAMRVDILIAILSVIERDWEKIIILQILKEAGHGLSTEEIALRLNDRTTKTLKEATNDHQPVA